MDESRIRSKKAHMLATAWFAGIKADVRSARTGRIPQLHALTGILVNPMEQDAPVRSQERFVRLDLESTD
jgi:hypothetical protein